MQVASSNFLEMPDPAKLLFDQMPRFMYFVKDRDFRFIRINQQLADKLGLEEDQILGKTDYDFFPKSMADAFRKDDEKMLQDLKPITNKVELVPSNHGQVDWSITTKVPLLDDNQSVTAIIGVTRAFSTSDTAMESSSEINVATKFIKENFASKLSIEDLAKRSSLSVSALERKFKAIFHVSPTQYILNTRVQKACHLLSQSTKNLASIAIECGFYDQSHFSKKFSKSMNISPLKYRKLYIL